MGNKWTDEELDALKMIFYQGYKGVEAYHKWADITGYSKTYDAWEVKRRRVAAALVPNITEEEDALILLTDLLKGQTVLDTPHLNQPHIGKKHTPSPDLLDYNFKIAFFDIETTDLKGNFGRILCASIADQTGAVTTFRGDDPLYRGAKVRDDSRLVEAIRDALETYDLWVTWNGKGFDMPFLDTRLLLAGKRPLRKDVMHSDIWYQARQFKLRLHSTRLDAVAKTFRLPVQKTVLDFDTLQDAAMGDSKALDSIVEHCEADVLVLREVFKILKPLIKIVHR